jgi:hypothetical protein
MFISWCLAFLAFSQGQQHGNDDKDDKDATPKMGRNVSVSRLGAASKTQMDDDSAKEEESDEEEDDDILLDSPTQIEEFHYYKGDQKLTTDSALAKVVKSANLKLQIWVGYRSLHDTNRTGDLNFAPWYSIMHDLKGTGKSPIYEYFEDSGWVPDHLPDKWNQTGYTQLSKIVGDEAACMALATKLHEEHIGMTV